ATEETARSSRRTPPSACRSRISGTGCPPVAGRTYPRTADTSCGSLRWSASADTQRIVVLALGRWSIKAELRRVGIRRRLAHDLGVNLLEAVEVLDKLLLGLRLFEAAKDGLQLGQLAFRDAAERAAGLRCFAHLLQAVETDIRADCRCKRLHVRRGRAADILQDVAEETCGRGVPWRVDDLFAHPVDVRKHDIAGPRRA